LLLTLLNVLVAIAGVSLALFLLFAARGYILRLQVAGIAIAAVIWAIWPRALAVADGAGIGQRFFPDLILLLGCFGLVERLLRGPYRQSLPLAVRNSLRWIWLLVLCLVLAALTRQSWLLSVLSLNDSLLLALLILSLLGLALAGQCYGDAIIEPRARLRHLCSAVTLMFAGMAFVHGIALLTAGEVVWPEVIRAVAMLFALFLFANGAQGAPQWSLAVFVSPQARLYAPRIISAAIALFLLLILAPLLRAAPETHAVLVPITVSIVIALLLIVLFSERVRAQLGVYGSKRFLPFRYDYRGEWLRLTDILAATDQERPLTERSILALAQIVDSSAGSLWLADHQSGSYVCVETSGMAKPAGLTVPLTDPAVEFMRSRNWILDTVEWQRRPELYAGLNRPDWLSSFPEAVLIVPLLSSEQAIGFVVLLQPSSKFRLTFEEIDLLRTSGRQVAAHLAQYQADRQLAEAKQFEALT
jgi:putative PEP-CTERM system histidine kinase